MPKSPDGWSRATIRSRLDHEFSGEWGSEPVFDQTNVKILRSTNLQDEAHIEYENAARRRVPPEKVRQKRLLPGDILLEASGGGPGTPVGRVAAFEAQPEGDFLCSNFFRTLRPTSSVDSRFLVWRLHHLYLQPSIWQFQQQTTGIINLKVSEYLDQALYWPPLDEQRNIAAVLDTADALTSAADTTIAKLKLMREGVRQNVITRGVDEDGRLRSAEDVAAFKETVVGGLLPEWDVVELGTIADLITSGSRGWARYYTADGPVFLRMGNLTREHLNLRFGDVVHVNPPTDGEGSRTALQSGDLLMSITADLGIIGIVPESLGEAYVNQHIALVRLKPQDVDPRWVGSYLASAGGRAQFDRLNDAGAKAGLNLPTVARLLIPLPPLEEQRRIASRLAEQDQRIDGEERQAAKLRSVKQGLLDELMTGKVQLPGPARRMDVELALAGAS